MTALPDQLTYGSQRASLMRREKALERRLSHLMTPPPFSSEERRAAWRAGYEQALMDIAARPDVAEVLR